MKRVETVAEEPPLAKAPWSKGRLISSKPPLRTKPVWSIRTKRKFDGRTRDFAMLKLAIDRETVDDCIKSAGKKPGEYLFASRL